MPVGSVRMLSPYTEFLLFSSKNSKLRRISQSWHYWHFGLHHSLFAATGYSVYIASLDPVAASGSLPLKTHHPPAWQANMSPDIAKCLPLIKKHCYRAPVENRKTLILCNSMDYSFQAPLSRSFSRQEYWSGLLFPSAGDRLKPGIEPMSIKSPAVEGVL